MTQNRACRAERHESSKGLLRPGRGSGAQSCGLQGFQWLVSAVSALKSAARVVPVMTRGTSAFVLELLDPGSSECSF